MIEHGMISWTDLSTFKVEEAKAFYAAAPGMKFQAFEMPNGTYWVALHGGKAVAATFDIPTVGRIAIAQDASGRCRAG